MPSEVPLALLVSLFVGKFLGVVILGMPKCRRLLFDHSVCDQRGRTLLVANWIPFASWLLLRARRGRGEARLALFYLGIEFAALAVAASAAAVLSGWVLWASLALGWTLLALAAIDLDHYWLPDRLTLPLIPFGLLVTWLINSGGLEGHAIGALAGFLAFASIAWTYRRLRRRAGLGLGDAKLLAAAGAWLGWPALPGLVVVAATLALAVALVRAAAGERLAAATRIAFGPYLAFALWLSWLYGPLVLAPAVGR